MNAVDLLLLAFKGIAVASLPLAWIWVGRARRSGGDRLRRLAWVAAFFTFDLIVFGGFTRLTDSGLGCPDWPGCYAKANPFMAAPAIRDAEAAMPYGPVSMGKAWIEMIHRYLAMAIGVLIIAMLAISVARRIAARRAREAPARARASPTRAYPGFVAGLLGLVMLQGAFGAWTVTQKLQPIFVTTHLLLGLTLLAALVWHALRFNASPPVDADRLTRGLARFAAVVVIAQVVLGGWVSANYAVLACSDFPRCQGVWLPPMDFANGFWPWRALGRSADGSSLSIAALTAIHWTHRTFAAVVLVVVAALAWRLRHATGLRRAAGMLAAVLLLQVATGLVNVVFAWPLVAAVLHNAGAAGLVATLVVINYRLRPLARSAASNPLPRRPTDPSERLFGRPAPTSSPLR